MSGLIPQLVIDEVLSRTDLVELIDGYWPLKRKGANFIACCPFHHERTPSFNVIPKKQFYYCFGCGASGNAIGFLIQHLHFSFVEAVEHLATRLGLTVTKDNTAEPKIKKPKADTYTLMQKVNDYYQSLLKKNHASVNAYIQKRGLNAAMLDVYQLGYALEDWHALERQFQPYRQALIDTGMLVLKEDGKVFDRYRNRLMFPIHNRQGQVIGFGGRALEDEQQPKYMNSPETSLFHKGRELYGLYQLIQHMATIETIIVVEGYMDVIALRQHEIPFVVATLGTATTPHHLQLLGQYTKNVVFCFDGDEAGRKAAFRALENSLPALDGQLSLSFMFLPEKSDPDTFVREVGKEAFLARMAESVSLHDFFFRCLSESLPMHTLQGRSQLVQAAVKYLQTMPDSAYKWLLIDQLARISRLDVTRIEALMQGEKESPREAIEISRSPVRLAIALLLQHPEVIVKSEVPVHLEVDLSEEGMQVLKSMFDYAQKTPNVNTAMLLEQWRESPWLRSLQKLSIWAHQVSESLVASEFRDLVHFFNKQYVEKQIQAYMAQSRQAGLNEEERLTLQKMIMKCHELT